jgi:predicted RNase H-like HicB family nuclease
VIVPDLSGCFSAEDSVDKVIVITHDAITRWIDVMRDLGGEVPPPPCFNAILYAELMIGEVEIEI